MKKYLDDLFIESDGRPILHKGRLVHAVTYREVTEPGRFIVRFLSAVRKPVQALSIGIEPGTLFIAGGVSAKMILRLDTCPDVVEVRYRPYLEGGRLVFYNEWIDESGRVDAWIMNAGMLVENKKNRMVLRCSDGRGEPTFDDLVVEILFPDE